MFSCVGRKGLSEEREAKMKKTIATVTMTVFATSIMMTESVEAGSATFIFEDTTYLSILDSPMDTGADDFHFEDFEDGLVNILGVTIDGGLIRTPSNFTDSVDADDGVIDGSGTDGHSYWQVNGIEGFTINFDLDILGGLPEEVGFVWTDGNTDGVFRFEAFGKDGVSVLDIVLGNEDHFGTTVEDRFLGVQSTGGISSIRLSSTFGGIEIDHLQYASIVPLPAPIALGLAGLFGVLVKKRRQLLAKN